MRYGCSADDDVLHSYERVTVPLKQAPVSTSLMEVIDFYQFVCHHITVYKLCTLGHSNRWHRAWVNSRYCQYQSAEKYPQWFQFQIQQHSVRPSWFICCHNVTVSLFPAVCVPSVLGRTHYSNLLLVLTPASYIQKSVQTCFWPENLQTLLS